MFLVLLSFKYVICRPWAVPILDGWKVALMESIFIMAFGSLAWKENIWLASQRDGRSNDTKRTN